ncbi:MAG: aryl-sulfate sulfotransferase [Lachnospiraceae bacterium]|nr:aryl-sulfate sulfotransferase [Lachnospiraceae bacterium]
MKKVNGILIVIALLSLALLAFIAYSTGIIKLPESQANSKDPQTEFKDDYEEDSTKNKEIAVTIAENLFSYKSISEIYSYEYQKMVRDRINILTEVGDYNEDNPLLILNPFGTNTQSLYTYFKTTEPCAVSYAVHTSTLTSEAPDFGGFVKASMEERILPNGATTIVGNSYVHEFAITGLVPNETNIITMRLIDENGETRIRRFYYKFGDVVSKDEEKLTVQAGFKVVADEVTGESKVQNASDVTLAEGMYAIFCKKNDFDSYVKLYDNSGFLRGEIPLEDTFAKKLFVKDGEIYLFVSSSKLVRINSLGEVTHIYRSNDYTFTGDWCVDGNGNILAAATRNDRSDISERDCIVIIDFTDGDIYMLIDFAKLMTDYHVRRKEADWIGISGVSYMGNNMIVVAADKLDSMIKIRRIYNDPRLVYFAGDPAALAGTVYESMYLFNEGNFAFSSTTEVAGYEEYDKIRQSRQYIWTLDRNLNYTYEKKEEGFGYYLKYLTDEDEKTVRIAETIKLPELTEDASLFEYGDNWLFVSGNESVFYEYDNWFDLIASFKFTEPVVRKTVEQMDYEEDNPPPDDTVIYIGACKFDQYDYLFTNELVVYKNGTVSEETSSEEGVEN